METQFVSIIFRLKNTRLLDYIRKILARPSKKRAEKEQGRFGGLFEKTFFFNFTFLHENFEHSH